MDYSGPYFWLLKGDMARAPLEAIQIQIYIEVDVYIDIDSYFGCSKWMLKSVQVLFHGIEAVMILTLMLLK